MKLKLFTLLFTIVVICINLSGQPVLIKQVASGGKADDYFGSMCVTKDKGLLAGGSSSSNISGNKTEDSRGGNDFWIVKYDKHGKIIWDKTIGGSDNDYLNAVAQTKDSGFILGGGSSSNKSGEKTEDSRGGGDMWVVKLDKAGNIQWDKTIGGSEYESLTSIEQTRDGGYIFGCSSRSNISGDKTQKSRGFEDYWVVKTDSAGNIQWQRTMGGGKADILTSVRQTHDGGFIVCGYSGSSKSGDKTEANKCNCGDDLLTDYWIVKLNNKGQIQWDKTLGSAGADGWNTIEQTRDGGYIVGGSSGSDASGDKTENSRGASDYWIVKLDDRGNKLWDKTIGGSDWDGNDGFSIQQTSDGGYIMASESSSNKSGDKTEDNTCPTCTYGDEGDRYFDYWVVKTDSTGKIEWDKTIGGFNEEDHEVVKELQPDVYIVGGSSYSGISGDKTIHSKGGADYWIVKLKYTDSATNVIASVNKHNIETAAGNTNKFDVFPNPAKDIIHIYAAGKTATFIITNSFGKVVLTQNITESGLVDVARLPSGVYFIKDNVSGVTRKIVIAK